MKEKQDITSTVSFGFKKEEKLCSKKAIEKLFAEGDAFLSYPIKVVFTETQLPSSFPVQAGFTVSKKNFKRAVKRNRIKRLMREAYRLKKHLLYEQLQDRQIAIFFVFIGKEIPAYAKINKAMDKAVSILLKKIDTNKDNS